MVVLKIESLKSRILITLKECKLRVIAYVKILQITVKAVYPLEFIATCKIKFRERIEWTPDTLKVRVTWKIPLWDVVTLTPQTFEIKEILDAFNTCYTHVLTVNIHDVIDLIIIKIPVTVLIKSFLNVSPEYRIRELFFNVYEIKCIYA